MTQAAGITHAEVWRWEESREPQVGWSIDCGGEKLWMRQELGTRVRSQEASDRSAGG